MEDELRALPNVKKIKTECQNGMAMLTVEFQMTVLQKDLEQHFDLLRRKVNDCRSKLPQDCYDPIVVDDMMDVYGIFYAFTGDGYTYPELYKYAKLIRRELLGVKGVKRILIAGNRDEVINITLPKEKIARNGIIPTQIMMNLQSAGKTVNAGNYLSSDDRLPLHVSNALTDEDDIRRLLVSTPQGKQIRLEDVARIERTYAEPQRNGFFVDGKPALAICLTLEENAIVPNVGKAVDRRLAEVIQQIPVGMETEKIFFQPDKVDEAIGSFMVNLVESVAIVILVLVFTMGFRSGVIIGFGLVLTIAMSFPILLVCGTTLQRISLGAFIVAMGMLVDNAIVIMDGILTDKKRGLGPKTYLYRIGQHTAIPLLGATVIAVDLDDEKLRLAKEIGAQHTVNSRTENVHERLAEITDGLGPDVVIEAVGSAPTYLMAVNEVSFTGRIVYIGYAKSEIAFQTKLFVQKELDIRGSRNALPEDFRAVIHYLNRKECPTDKLISRIIRPEEAGEALKEWADNPGKVFRILVSFV